MYHWRILSRCNKSQSFHSCLSLVFVLGSHLCWFHQISCAFDKASYFLWVPNCQKLLCFLHLDLTMPWKYKYFYHNVWLNYHYSYQPVISRMIRSGLIANQEGIIRNFWGNFIYGKNPTNIFIYSFTEFRNFFYNFITFHALEL